MATAVERFQAILVERGLESRVRQLSENTRTAADTAARQLTELLLTTEGVGPRATRARQ